MLLHPLFVSVGRGGPGGSVCLARLARRTRQIRRARQTILLFVWTSPDQSVQISPPVPSPSRPQSD